MIEPERRSDERREQRRERRDEEDVPRAGEHAREDVAPEAVGAERSAAPTEPTPISGVWSNVGS